MMESPDTTTLMVYATIFGGVAGAIVSAIYDGAIKSFLVKRSKKSSLKKELLLFQTHIQKNIDKIKEYKEEYLKHSRSEDFYHYFDLTRFASFAVKDVIASGLLYEFFTISQIESLFKIDNIFSQGAEKLINDHIAAQKSGQADKKNCYQQVKYWEDEFNSALNELQVLLRGL
jgi:hypothetical protein